jgi:hypothetical protein
VVGFHEDQDATEEVLADDTVLDVVCVVFYTERQQLQDQTQQLNCLIVVLGRNVVYCVG